MSRPSTRAGHPFSIRQDVACRNRRPVSGEAGGPRPGAESRRPEPARSRQGFALPERCPSRRPVAKARCGRHPRGRRGEENVSATRHHRSRSGVPRRIAHADTAQLRQAAQAQPRDSFRLEPEIARNFVIRQTKIGHDGHHSCRIRTQDAARIAVTDPCGSLCFA